MTLKTFAIISLLSVSTAMAHEGSSSGTRGGGRTVNGLLYDLYQKASESKVDPKDLDGFHKVTERILAHVQQTVPAFAQELADSLTQRQWVFVDSELACGDQTPLKINADLIACQGLYKVRVQRQKFLALTVQTQGEIIIHEMVRYVFMKHKMTDDDAVYDVVPMLIERVDETTLRAALKNYGYGSYKTHTEVLELAQTISQAKRDFVQKVESIRSGLSGASTGRELNTKAGNELLQVWRDLESKYAAQQDQDLQQLQLKMMDDLETQVRFVMAGSASKLSAADAAAVWRDRLDGLVKRYQAN
jgi:molybdenum-dependent DNA-binding transcriptional regulator ModE